MRASHMTAMAASLVAICVAAPALLRTMQADAPVVGRVEPARPDASRRIADVGSPPPPRPTVATAEKLTLVEPVAKTVSPAPVADGTVTASPAPQAASTDGAAQLRVTADELLRDTANSYAIARGQVALVYKDATITADQLIFDRAAGTLTAIGNVRLQSLTEIIGVERAILSAEVVAAFAAAVPADGRHDTARIAVKRTTLTTTLALLSRPDTDAANAAPAGTAIVVAPPSSKPADAAGPTLQVAEAVAKAKEQADKQSADQAGTRSRQLTEEKRGADQGGVLDRLAGPGAGAPLPGRMAAGAPPASMDGRVAAVPAAPPAVAPQSGRSQLLLYPGQLKEERQAGNGGRLALPGIVISPRPENSANTAPLENRDRFAAAETNPVKSVAAEPVSTFSVDVDTASYSLVRRSLNAGRLPPKDAVRVEEMVNYFPYDYARPESADAPFRANVQVFPSPWNASNQLVHIGLKGYDLKSAERPRANLVFLVDISGSMAPADRLPLLKNAFRMLLDNLRPNDTVAIVTYAAGSDIRLAPTQVADKARILAAIDSLNANGSTHGAAGINDAYKVAEASFDKAAVNRVILATDGDWNVGITNREELKGFVERKRQTGIYLSVLGVGMGNHNDALMQALAQNGNGAAAYIDTLSEARKVLVDEASSTLFPIAKDVKIQLEFNPARVSEYRLIGYETRMLRREDFNNDKVDAGDVGSGHSVTAIYEITPVGAPALADALRYGALPARGDTLAGDPGSGAGRPPRAIGDGRDAEIGFLKLRYKLPKEEASRLAEFVVGPEQTKRTLSEASADARFSVAVAAFGQMLRGAPYLQGFSYDEVIAMANAARGDDPFGYRAEFVILVRLAKSAR